VSVYTLDKCLETICEPDLIFHLDKEGLLAVLSRAVSAMKNISLMEIPRNVSIKVPNLTQLM
ncbi:UNVERIFIED_CONTAM: hypothetical protein H355_002895, partial [Colinus virginianus]